MAFNGPGHEFENKQRRFAIKNGLSLTFLLTNSYASLYVLIHTLIIAQTRLVDNGAIVKININYDMCFSTHKVKRRCLSVEGYMNPTHGKQY